MPTISQILLPLPAHEHEFEMVTKDYCQLKYGNAELMGRRGQSQHGIDIYCKYEDKFIGVQCKQYKRLSISDINDIIEQAKEFPLVLDTLIIATTAPRDTRIQEYIMTKSQESKQEISMLYWDTISGLLKQHPDILHLHYPQGYDGVHSIQAVKVENITEEYIKKQFNEAIQAFNVISFVRIDIEGGVPQKLPTYIDIFCHEMDALLKKAILLQTTNTYINIMLFSNEIKKYSGYLSRIMYPTNGGTHTIQNERDLRNIDLLREQDLAFKTALNELYEKINDGLNLFTY